jgi:hypothetical protein
MAEYTPHANNAEDFILIGCTLIPLQHITFLRWLSGAVGEGRLAIRSDFRSETYYLEGVEALKLWRYFPNTGS